MEIDEAQTGRGEEIFLEQLAIGHHHAEIGLQGDEVRRIGGFELLRLQERQAFGARPGDQRLRRA